MTNGIPFMVTTAMKEALRQRGLADADIKGMTPAEAHKLLLSPDPHTVHAFLEAFVGLATASLVGYPPPGLLQMCRKHPDDNDLVPVRYRLDDTDLVERMTQDALAASEAGLNVYIEGRLVRSDLRGKRRGELKDTVCVFALTVDSDADKNRAWVPSTTVRPTLAVETSPGNAQYWFFFDCALSPDRAQCLGESLRRSHGKRLRHRQSNPALQDSRHHQLSQQDEDRPRTRRHADLVPRRWRHDRSVAVQDMDGGGIRAGVLLSPCVVAAQWRRGRNTGDTGEGESSTDADDIDESVLPDELMKLIRDGVPRSRDRSRKFMKAAGWLEELGFGVEGAYKLFARYPDGIAQKYTKPRDRLRREVERAYDKVKAGRSDRPPPRPCRCCPLLSSSAVLAAGHAHAVFKKWLGEEIRYRRSRCRSERCGGRKAGRRSLVA